MYKYKKRYKNVAVSIKKLKSDQFIVSDRNQIK